MSIPPPGAASAGAAFCLQSAKARVIINSDAVANGRRLATPFRKGVTYMGEIALLILLIVAITEAIRHIKK